MNNVNDAKIEESNVKTKPKWGKISKTYPKGAPPKLLAMVLQSQINTKLLSFFSENNYKLS